MIDINLRSVIATRSAGGGLTSLRRICTDFNFPEPVTGNSYNGYIRHVEEQSIANCECSLSDAAEKLRKMKLNGEDDGRIIRVGASVDCAWQKRYGFNSLNGMVFVISIDTGRVLDYVVKMKCCHVCKANRKASNEWKRNHKKDRCVNHEKSSGAMEVEGSIEMFLRSVNKHNTQHKSVTTIQVHLDL